MGSFKLISQRYPEHRTFIDNPKRLRFFTCQGDQMSVNTLILGAAGRDFHNFNLFYRDNDHYSVKAFTATQIPDIEGRRYPASLAGALYPEGIPIFPEEKMEELIEKYKIEEAVFAYSDLPHEVVMQLASRVIAAGADFKLMGWERTVVRTEKPVISICAVRTGCGKSQTTRKVVSLLTDRGLKVAVIRHPMPYGDLAAQRVQRFASLEDLDKHECTIEEREEYEPHIIAGTVVYAGVDYGDIAAEASKEADILLWDGGNNDLPFLKSDLQIVVTDPLRSGDEITYHPGEANLRMADVVIINKIDSAEPDQIEEVRMNIRDVNPDALIIDAASPLTIEDGHLLRGKKVLVVEDGPTLTHGEMDYGAGVVAAVRMGVDDLVDPRPYTVGTITETFEKYPNIGELLPAMGYGDKQVRDLQETIAATECDAVIIGTPIDLRRIVKIDKPSHRVRYDIQEIGYPDLRYVIDEFLSKTGV